MIKYSKILLGAVIFSFTFFSIPSISAYDSTRTELIYKFDIKEEIAPPVWRNTQNAFAEAKEINADHILIHMNTYGGLLDAADSIRTIILQSKIPVYIFIDNNAASAGALISIACDSIYMREGANIGAATVVDQSGKPLPDKYQSYMRSLMRSTAEASGRDPDIAQAMVDPRVYIENVSDTGNVLTFTTSEAIKYNYCEGKAASISEVIALIGITDYKVIEQELSAMDHIIGFLIKPYISGILIMLIIGGIYFELQSPGLGFPSAAAIMGALLYFAPLYMEGIAEHWEIALFFVGVVLIAIEIFAIPGFGIAGISGILFVITGLTLSMVESFELQGSDVNITPLVNALFTVITATFLSIVGSIYLSRKMLTSKAFGHLALASTQDAMEGFSISEDTYANVIGQRGIAHTKLRPAGKVIINEEHFDATALTGFIDKGKEIEVVKYETAQLFVIEIKNNG
ncbi:MAG: nodulation protein NfeD [Bacteroidetes bacterium]|nr:MAG: nodulation protein NfeD [Bacteroidota bacterium]